MVSHAPLNKTFGLSLGSNTTKEKKKKSCTSLSFTLSPIGLPIPPPSSLPMAWSSFHLNLYAVHLAAGLSHYLASVHLSHHRQSGRSNRPYTPLPPPPPSSIATAAILGLFPSLGRLTHPWWYSFPSVFFLLYKRIRLLGEF